MISARKLTKHLTVVNQCFCCFSEIMEIPLEKLIESQLDHIASSGRLTKKRLLVTSLWSALQAIADSDFEDEHFYKSLVKAVSSVKLSTSR